MITSQVASFFVELAAGHAGPPIPEEKLVYFRTRARNRLFDFLLGLFVAEQKNNGLTKAALARRIGKSPEVINRWLGSPSNLTIDSISDLLLGISAEEMKPTSEALLNQGLPNYSHWQGASDIKTESRSSTGTVLVQPGTH